MKILGLLTISGSSKFYWKPEFTRYNTWVGPFSIFNDNRFSRDLRKEHRSAKSGTGKASGSSSGSRSVTKGKV